MQLGWAYPQNLETGFNNISNPSRSPKKTPKRMSQCRGMNRGIGQGFSLRVQCLKGGLAALAKALGAPNGDLLFALAKR